MVSIDSLKPGDRVVVKVGKNLVACAVVETVAGKAVVRSESTGREFKAAKVEELVARAAEIAEAAADIADEEAATAELRSREENGGAAEESSPAAEEPAAPPKPARPAKGKAGKAAEPPRKLSLANAAVEVLRQEGKPLNTRELVKLATERGLWTPTACRTPEQSLYGAFFLEIKNSDSPRIKKSAERGKFELA